MRKMKIPQRREMEELLMGGGRVAQQVNLLEHAPLSGANILKEQEKKRPRRSGGGEDGSTSAIVRSAPSFEEGDQAQ